MTRTASALLGLGTVLAAGAASAGPAPDALRGAWTDDADCAAATHVVIFTRDTMEMRRTDPTAAKSATIFRIEAAGDPGGQVRISLVKRLSAAPPAPGLPNVGDALTVQVIGDSLQPLAASERGRTKDVSKLPPMRRCPE